MGFTSQLRGLPLVGLCIACLGLPRFTEAGTTTPYYQRKLPAPQNEADFASESILIDLRNARMTNGYTVAEARRLFDKRAATAVRSTTGIDFRREVVTDGKTNYPAEFGPRIFPNVQIRPIELGDDIFQVPYGVSDLTSEVNAKPGDHLYSERDLLEMKWYGLEIDDAFNRTYKERTPTFYMVRGKCLGLLAYADYFPNTLWQGLRQMVSTAILQAGPGFCGTFGPGVDAATDLFADEIPEGNYDMTQMFLLPMIYRYYDEITPEAREHLIVELLAHGLVHRPRVPDGWTHGVVPEDWSRAGFVSPLGVHVRIGETENHILMITTVRYLVNQLLYQRNPHPDYDNRRNGSDKRPSCMGLLLFLLQGFLQNDFSEYNAKNYQSETRWALLNLCSYAYDSEVRLAARMVLDYISAHIAVSSSDTRRMVPFRRRNQDPYSKQIPGGVMDVGLLDWTLGADPMSQYFAMQSGNVRAYEAKNGTTRPWDWAILSDGTEALIEVLSDYRLPPSIHDLFVNDADRRFYQRLHRFAEDPEQTWATGRNADNMELYAGSPSYLLTAGGAPGPWAIDPGPAIVQLFTYRDVQKQLGVALPSSFMPTWQSEEAGIGKQNQSTDLIQFGHFSDGFYINIFGEVRRNSPPVANYGVAPDLIFGHKIYAPAWLSGEADGPFTFVNRGSSENGVSSRPGFYLAIFRDGQFACMEAFDTWLHPNVTFEQFKVRVKANNPGFRLQNNVEALYTTLNGNRVRLVIWSDMEREGAFFGAKVLHIDYGAGDPKDGLGDAGNVTDRFLNGSILNSPARGIVEISNPSLGTKITLDMSNAARPRRVAEDGSVEEGGPGAEVWVDFAWNGPGEGDFYRPFKTLGAAIGAVAPGGVIKIVPGTTTETVNNPAKKHFRMVAPIGGVRIGAR